MEQTRTEFHKDFRDLCELLNAARVDFLIVGGYAVAFHGAPRFTGDLDLFIRPEPDHVARMLAALIDFGYPAAGTEPDYLLTQKKILQLGHVPVQVHLMTEITGVNWADAWSSRKGSTYGGVPIFFLGLSVLIANKTATGRAKDLADAEALRSREDRS